MRNQNPKRRSDIQCPSREKAPGVIRQDERTTPQADDIDRHPRLAGRMNSADGLSPTTRPGGAIDPASVSLPPTRIVDLTAATHSDVAIVAPDER
jgi:hypothetical protein